MGECLCGQMTGAEWREIRYGNEGGGVVVRGQEEGVGYMGVGVCACGGGGGQENGKVQKQGIWHSMQCQQPPPPSPHLITSLELKIKIKTLKKPTHLEGKGDYCPPDAPV